MDYYGTLGLNKGASTEDIKKAYRSMAMKHHPDRGGDESRFKEIEEAYRTLSDPQKKQIIDQGMDPNSQFRGGFKQGDPFEFHFGTENLNDIFSNFGFGFGSRRMQRNRSFNVNVTVTLEEILTGKEVNAEIGLQSGEQKLVAISIPAGIENGQSIRYQGMGDHSYRDVPPGDLIVNVRVLPHVRFRREGDNLVYDHKISVWDAIVGSNIKVITLDNKSIDVIIPPGTQPETVLSCKGEGMPNIRSRQRGNLLIKIQVEIPRNLSEEQKNAVRTISKNV